MKSRSRLRIVVGVDPSEHARHAALWAAREAHDSDGSLTIAHALDLPDGAARRLEPAGHEQRRREEGESLVRRIAQAVTARWSDVVVRTVISDLAPARELVALSLDADLLVTGTRGHGGFTGMLLGSVSQRLAAHAHCPTVVVGCDQPERTRDEVVLAVGRDEAPETVDFAFATAQRLGRRVRAVRAFQPIATYLGHVQESVTEARDTALFGVESLIKIARETYPDVPVTVEARHGVTVPTLCDAARGARLLVVGSRRGRGALGIGPGHIVHGLLSHSDTPVAVVPIG